MQSATQYSLSGRNSKEHFKRKKEKPVSRRRGFKSRATRQVRLIRWKLQMFEDAGVDTHPWSARSLRR